MLSHSPLTQSPPSRVPSVKFYIPPGSSVRKLSPPEMPERRESYNRARAEGPQPSVNNPSQGAHRSMSAADEERRRKILSVTQPGKYQIPSRASSARDGLLGHVIKQQRELPTLRRVSRVQASNLAQAQRSRSLKLRGPLLAPMQSSQTTVRPDKRPALRTQTEPIPRQKTKHVYTPCHSRAPLAPFLSAPARILSTISHLNPGGSLKIIQRKVHSSILVNNKKNSSVVQRPPNTLSRSQCSPQVQKAVSNHRNNAHNEENQVLEGFLKNNGVYLEDSNPEVDQASEDTENEVKNPTLKKNTLLKRIPYTLQLRNSIRLSSFGSSHSSGSSNSNK
ncbi:hypothetical protein PCANC_06705 [Puccinia coronata f. sp. avenae]|uniref:Uncharacterized protein n=1 Tax=Puccinia coronata f. sp. avenae TaxID=200324 RepID=A0A2N5V657_9BASI|nr:hypothetical protein PCASD_05907 [Puccinia coronata f. sp. avenae]PLW53592.1 hypothetical protein PCANC_06705 [Puccinia coronata f. sp. avenae]